MRIVRFAPSDGIVRPGVHLPSEDTVIDVPTVGDSLDIGVPSSVQSLLAEPCWQEKLELIQTHARESGEGLIDREKVSFDAPISDPQKIICVGLNYSEHVEEAGDTAPDNPVLFAKYPTAITGPEKPIRWDPNHTSEVDYEAELAVVIGEEGRRINESDARDHVAGYTVANDVSARDLQFSDEQWVRGKTLDTFCPLGPGIVTDEEITDPESLEIWADLNGERMQESTTDNLLFGIDNLISFCSDAFTLTPGDVILTGTPPGVGKFREPPTLLDDTDEITVGVEGIGELTNPCVHETTTDS